MEAFGRAMTQRTALLEQWLRQQPGLAEFVLEPASGDASFRRYFRVHCPGATFVAMDAPPATEDCRPFVKLARLFGATGLNVPRVLAQDLQRGFLLLGDLGNRLYLDLLTDANVDRMYGDALAALVVIQTCGPTEGLPPYDQALLMRELELFREWLLGRRLGLDLDTAEEEILTRAFEILCKNALEQPQVCVHRDFHSRNLLLTEPPSPGILDFQDAVVGPVTYDLVSLLRDCYVDWPEERVRDWAQGYFLLALQSGILRPEHQSRFHLWFDRMGIQRHLKASGIFARLDVRDGKSAYLKDIPRTLRYVVRASAKDPHPLLAALSDLVATRVLPACLSDGPAAPAG